MRHPAAVRFWLICCFLSAAFPTSGAFAEPSERPDAPDSPFQLEDDPERPRSDLVMPLISVRVPGFAQWIEGQYAYGALYTGVGAAGLAYAYQTQLNNDILGRREKLGQIYRDADEDYFPLGPADDDVAERKLAFGNQVLQSMGGMSSYHAFRTAVRSRQGHGQYEFLRYEETPQEVFLAPFDFSYLKRQSTWIPLATIALYSAWQLSLDIPDEAGIESRAFTGDDAFFSLGFSYNAGTHEEAMFRGWIQPAMREYSGSDFWSNGLTSVLFAVAHLGGNNQFPLVQALLGYHLGEVTMMNDWRIGEAVFIHTWWDVFAFAATYHYKRKLPEPVAAALRPTLWLPALKLAF